jgi:hypothetical protein
MLAGYKKQSSEWLLDELIKEANTVEFPSESNLLFELRSELLSRLTKHALDGVVCTCKTPHMQLFQFGWLCVECGKPPRK